MNNQEKQDLLEAEKKKKTSEDLKDAKTELANKIAKQSSRVADSYRNFENVLYRIIRMFSSFIDKILFNRKHGKLVAFVLAVIMYISVNYNTVQSVYTNTLRSSRQIPNVPVEVNYNSDTFEVTGVPTSANITITGDATSVTSAVGSKDGKVIADLEGLTEGTHEVRLSGEGFGNSVNVVVDPTTVVVTLAKKTTQQFNISYDFINQDRMEDVYSPGTPEFEYTKVNIRASKDTLDSIAFVKALIDVSGQNADFEQDAKLIAYDSSGNPVNADIVPNTVHVKVPVTSPNKSVPIKVQVDGTVPDGKAIDAITMDQQTVTIYGSDTVLANIDNVSVTLDASTLTQDSTVLRPIILPAGVSSASISQVTMNVTLGDAVTKTVAEVPINVKNNVNRYKASQPDNITTVSVEVTGTQANVDAIKPDKINVYIDMSDAKPGLQEFTLHVEQPTGGLVQYILKDTSYKLNVLGEVEDAGEEGVSINDD